MQPSVPDNIEWGQPHFLEEKPILPWPENVFPKVIGTFANELSRSTETPIELSAMLSLSVLATVCQAKYLVQVKEGYLEPTNLWTVSVLPPASRKSSVYKTLTAPLRSWENQQKTILEPLIQSVDSQLKTIEARLKGLRLQASKVTCDEDYCKLQSQIEEIENKAPRMPRLPQIWASDVTNEQLGVIMSQNEDAMSLLSDEGGIFDIIGGLYSEGRSNIDLLLQAHSGSPVRVDRGSRPPIFMERAILTMGLTVQPEVIRKISSNKTYRGRGLLGRFLYIIPKSNIGHRKLDAAPMPPEPIEEFKKLIISILNHSRPVDSGGDKNAQHILFLEESAYEKWLDNARCIESLMSEELDHLCHITDWAGKLPGAIARIAGLLHVARYAHEHPWKHKISLEDMNAAVKIGHTLTSHALAIFDLCEANTAHIIYRWIKEKKMKCFTMRECKKKFSRRQNEELKKGLVALEEADILYYLKAGNGGRHSEIHFVNPSIWQQK